MPSQGKQDQSNKYTMEDSTMTIEFLRARLLAERSVSKTARERAGELTKRVAELEEQLRIVSVQRMKAEKATANVLVILESNGLSDASEAFDSSSDQDDESEFGLVNGRSKEVQSSVNSKTRKSESDERSGSDEFSPSPARSLSWKSSKDGTGSIKRCKEPALRSCNTFTYVCSSPKHRPGKSCRQVRRKEARAGDLDKALEQQAQLVERYEEMEKAQREWEEKFRENSSSTPDSCDPGNRSDVTEEAPYEINEQLPHAARTTRSTNHVEQSEVEDFPKVQPNGNLQQTVNREHLKVQNSSIPPASGSRCHDFACSLVEGKHNEAHLAAICSSPSSSSHEHRQTHCTNGASGSQSTHDFQTNRASDINKERAFGSQSEVYALVPHKTPKELGILEALKQAKQSLQQQIDKIPSVVVSSLVETYDLSSLLTTAPGDEPPEIPVRYPGLFRLPTEFPAPGGSEGNNFHSLNKRSSLDSELSGSSRADILSNSARSSFENYHSGKNPEAAVSNQLVAIHNYSGPKMKFPTDNHLLTSKQYLDGASMQRQRIDPSMDIGLPSSRSVYPAFPVSPVYGDLMFRVPP